MKIIKLKVVKNKELGIIEVVETHESHFSLSLFFSDIGNENTFKELFSEINLNSGYYTMSYDSSMVELFPFGAIVADQEDEFRWFFNLKNFKDSLEIWRNILSENKFPTEIFVSARLLSDSEYNKMIKRSL